MLPHHFFFAGSANNYYVIQWSIKTHTVTIVCIHYKKVGQIYETKTYFRTFILYGILAIN